MHNFVTLEINFLITLFCLLINIYCNKFLSVSSCGFARVNGKLTKGYQTQERTEFKSIKTQTLLTSQNLQSNLETSTQSVLKYYKYQHQISTTIRYIQNNYTALSAGRKTDSFLNQNERLNH